jgi:hypothetical protein
MNTFLISAQKVNCQCSSLLLEVPEISVYTSQQVPDKNTHSFSIR